MAKVPDITTLQHSAKTIVRNARKANLLKSLTPRIIRQEIETTFSLEPASLDGKVYKSAIREAVAAAMVEDLDDAEEDAEIQAQPPKKRKPAGGEDSHSQSPKRAKSTNTNDAKGGKVRKKHKGKDKDKEGGNEAEDADVQDSDDVAEVQSKSSNKRNRAGGEDSHSLSPKRSSSSTVIAANHQTARVENKRKGKEKGKRTEAEDWGEIDSGDVAEVQPKSTKNGKSFIDENSHSLPPKGSEWIGAKPGKDETERMKIKGKGKQHVEVQEEQDLDDIAEVRPKSLKKGTSVGGEDLHSPSPKRPSTIIAEDKVRTKGKGEGKEKGKGKGVEDADEQDSDDVVEVQPKSAKKRMSAGGEELHSPKQSKPNNAKADKDETVRPRIKGKGKDTGKGKEASVSPAKPPKPKEKKALKPSEEKATDKVWANSKASPSTSKLQHKSEEVDSRSKKNYGSDSDAKSESELSVLIDEPPRRKTSKSKDSEKAKKNASTKKVKSLAVEPSKDEATIKRLKSLVVACGMRKVWSKEFKDLDTPSAQIRRLKDILAELGMEGRMSLEQAKAIRAKRELAQELEDVISYEKAVLGNKEKVGEADDSDEEENASTKRKTAARSIMAFLADQSDSE